MKIAIFHFSAKMQKCCFRRPLSKKLDLQERPLCQQGLQEGFQKNIKKNQKSIPKDLKKGGRFAIA